ncbi:right-handed parallel beta-helix repeat-containing protein [Paenibacillus sp. sgz500958]|uniref:right-handed parallel beta-helix repeat-containing protein n=1 Tax=Paenibacillus sp. sgz500958 TaxID=3242475 RepID=UPI0036D2F2AB
MKKVLLVVTLLISSWLTPLATSANVAVTNISPLSAASLSQYSDIPVDHLAFSEISKLKQDNVMGGYADGTFKPDSLITRPEIAKIAEQLEKLPASGTNTAVNKTALQQYALGFSTGAFGPMNTLNKADMALLLASIFYLNAPGGNITLPVDVTQQHYAASSVLTLLANGIADTDASKKYYPTKTITRAEFAIFLARALYPEFRIQQQPASTSQPTVSVAPTSVNTATPAAGSGSTNSPTPTPTPSAGLDVTAPKEVLEPTATDDGKSITLTWSNPPDEDFNRVEVYQEDSLLGTSKSGSYAIVNVLSETTYEYTLKTVDNSKNISAGAVVAVTTKDITPPAVPVIQRVTDKLNYPTIEWNDVADKDLAGYNIYVNGVQANTNLIAAPTYDIQDLEIGVNYNFKVEAVDKSGNKSPLSEAASYKLTKYMIDLSKFNIYKDGTHPVETTAGLNKALEWVAEKNIKVVTLPAGTYLIDKNSQINMVPNITLDLSTDVIFQKETNGYEFYSLLLLDYGDDNVTIKGGTFVGDRLTHDYSKKVAPYSGTHELGYGILSKGVKNLTIDGVKLTNFTGDGILLGASGITKDMYENDFTSGGLSSTGQAIADTSKIRTKNKIQLTNPRFLTERYFELASAMNIPGIFDVYLYKADGSFVSKLQGKKLRDIISIPDGVTQFDLVFTATTYKGAYLELLNRALTRDSVIMNSESSFNRRQGISLTGVDNVLVQNNSLHDIKGTAPESGIDLEGGFGENGDRVINVTIKNNEFYNNSAYDLILYDGNGAKVEGNHFASTGKIGVYVSTPYRNAWISNNHFDGTRLMATHDSTLLNNKLNDSSATVNGPNVIIDGLDITNGSLISSVTSPAGVSISNVKITINKPVEAGFSVWSNPVTVNNLAINGQGSTKVISGQATAGSVFNNLKVINYSSTGMQLPAGTYNNSTFQAAVGNAMGAVTLAGGQYVFNGCTFISNANGAVPLYGEHADLNLTVRNSTFTILGDSTAISVQKAKSVLLENNTISALNMKRTDLPLIAINDYWKRSEAADVMSATISGNTINSNIAAIGISTIYAGTGAPAYTITNNKLVKAKLALKTNDVSSGNTLN